MQKEMGCPLSKASTLNLEFTAAEVREFYSNTCQAFNHWQRKQIMGAS